jgi:hypothetical protein
MQLKRGAVFDTVGTEMRLAGHLKEFAAAQTEGGGVRLHLGKTGSTNDLFPGVF